MTFKELQVYVQFRKVEESWNSATRGRLRKEGREEGVSSLVFELTFNSISLPFPSFQLDVQGLYTPSDCKNFVQWGILAEDVLDTSSQGNPFAGSELHPIQQRMMTVQSLYCGTEERPEVQVSFTSPSPSPPFIPLVLDPSSTDP